MSWEFHFRNFTETEQWVGCYHIGCGGVPWHDDRPRCWSVDIPNNPGGGYNSVYVPSDWVVHFDNWFKLIIDGLKFLKDIGLFIGSGGEDAEALVEAIKDVLDVSDDAIKAAAEENKVDLDELVQNAKASFERSCQSIVADPKAIRQMAAEMGLGTNWAFIAGPQYVKAIHDNSKYVSGEGWTVLSSASDAATPTRKANHAFIQNGHIIQAIPKESGAAHSMSDYMNWFADTMQRAAKGQKPAPLTAHPGDTGLLWLPW